MRPEYDDSEESLDSKEMAEEIVSAVDESEDDALTRSERDIERKKEIERVKKAKELKRQLRKRELGLLSYRWPALILIVAGILSIWTEFLDVMVHPEDLGYDSFWQMFNLTTIENGALYFIIPVIAGVLFIICGIIAYRDPRGAFAAILPSLMMIMAGANVYFQVTFLVTVAYELGLEVELYATGAPLTMLLCGLLGFLALAMREKE